MTRSLPHGFYSLFVVVLAASGWFASLWQGDGCNYAIVKGDIVNYLEALAKDPYGSTRYITTIELGFDSYRELPNARSEADSIDLTSPTDGFGADGTIADETRSENPEFAPSISTNLQAMTASNATTNNLSQQQQQQQQQQHYTKSRCVDYPDEVMNSIVDDSWTTSRTFAFLGLAVGGGGTTFLLCSLCFVFSRVTWRWTGYGLLLAAFCQLLSLFAWFKTQICSWNDCGWSRGSISDACAVAIWALTGFLVLVHYPSVTLEATIPAPGKVVSDGNGDHVEAEDIEKDLSGKTHPSFEKDEVCDRLRYPQAQIA